MLFALKWGRLSLRWQVAVMHNQSNYIDRRYQVLGIFLLLSDTSLVLQMIPRRKCSFAAHQFIYSRISLFFHESDYIRENCVIHGEILSSVHVYDKRINKSVLKQLSGTAVQGGETCSTSCEVGPMNGPNVHMCWVHVETDVIKQFYPILNRNWCRYRWSHIRSLGK